MKELNKLKKICKELNYNFFIQYYDGEFTVGVDDNNHLIDKEIAEAGGHEDLKDALIQVLKKVG